MTWNHITHKGQRFELGHLRDFTFIYVQKARKENEQDLLYPLDVVFSWHCFTRGALPTDDYVIERGRERRCFRPDRYALSHKLPGIVRALDQDKCRHTGRGNFFLIKLIGEDGQERNYEIYFQVKKQSGRKNMELRIESAYVRTKADPNRSKKKPIRFSTIVYNRKYGKPIRS